MTASGENFSEKIAQLCYDQSWEADGGLQKYIFIFLTTIVNRRKIMANLIVICGPHAVGKMTVAESLRDKLRYNMMMNHDSIELSDRIFGFATPAQKELNECIREKTFEMAVKHNVDLIFTYVCAFDEPEEKTYLTQLKDLFEHNGGRFFFVELFADIETRLARNETPHRMERKPSEIGRAHV